MAKKNETNAEKLIDQFSSLVLYTEKLAFPDYRDGILARKDMAGRSTLQKFLNRIAHSTFSIDSQSLLNVFLFLFWAYGSAASLAFGVVFIKPNLYKLTFPEIQPYSLVNDTAIIIFTTILAALILPVAIYWWHEVLTEKRYPIILKIAWFGLFLYLLFEFGKKLDFNNVTIGLWFDPKSGLLRALILHFAPAITYFIAIGLDLLITVYYLLKVIFGGIRSIHDPLPFDEMKKLLTEDIPGKDSKKSWHLSRLTSSEVQTISQWATANRDATEKRTIPISIVLGLLAVISISGFVQTKADNFVANWFNLLTTIYKSPLSVPLLTSVFNLGLFFILITFIMLITVSLIRLFVNLTVQNIIIETCIVAQFDKKNTDQEEKRHIQQGDHHDKRTRNHAISS